MRMMMYGMMAASVMALSLASTGSAQGTDAGSVAPDSTKYLKAIDLVSNGEPEEGRELVDSLFRLAKPGTAAYAEGLYWRARLSAMGPEAERDYQRIIVDYALTPRVPDALLRLGQLELMRGDRDGATKHFRRILLEHPASPVLAQANYWLARSYFEINNFARACAANAEAMAKVKPVEIELKNQIDFQNQRCQGVKFTAADTLAEAKAEAAAASGIKPKKTFEEASTARPQSATTTKPAPTKPATKPATKTVPVQTASSDEPVVVEDPVEPEKPAPVKPTPKTTASKPASPAVPPSAPTPAAKPSTSGAFSVQIAAYSHKDQAATMARLLAQQGYNARVDGTQAPFRVRIGKYKTRAEAHAMLAKLRAKKIDGFVTQE